MIKGQRRILQFALSNHIRCWLSCSDNYKTRFNIFGLDKNTLLALCSMGTTLAAQGTPHAPVQPVIAPGTISATSVTFVWDKPDRFADIKQYHIFLNGKETATSMRCNYRFDNLQPATKYQISLSVEDKDGQLSPVSGITDFTTKAPGKVLKVTDFGARGDGTTLNTKAIQSAIKACPNGGTVLIPAGTFVSGALFLKSNMTLEIARGGVLQGSSSTEDYLPFINNRFEGWELKTYASLLNAGIMNHKGGFSVENLSIKGEGTIRGAGGSLGKAMIAKNGIRSRGRLILLMNCFNVDLQGLKIENSPCWTVHYIYSKGISCHDLDIVSTARNGDGLDPDSSDDSYIFNCTFSTGDDCIAIKSGKNPEGYLIGKPTRNVRITDCNFIKGHGISIGSEMSGGISGILVRDCKAGKLLYGMQIKGTKDRGGYVRDLTVADCKLLQITVFSAVNYNNDGSPAREVPVFENFVFRNLDLSDAPPNVPVMDLNGFKETGHELKNVTFTNVILPGKAKIVIKNASQITFTNVKSVDGSDPSFDLTGCTDIVK